MKKMMALMAFTVFAATSFVMATAYNDAYLLSSDDSPHDTIDISGNNTSSSYVTYEKSLRITSGKTVDVLMARYSYFNAAIKGNGTLCLHAGGERCYLGTAKGASYPDWKSFTGDVHIYPYKENSPSAGFFGIIMAHGGKTFSVEDVEGCLKSGKVNIMMENNRVTLHDGATLACESGNRGFRFGELNTEVGSTIQGYMKSGSYHSYFLVGCLNTDATLAGTIAPPSYSSQHKVGLVKEGTGTYSITGNNNFISGALRVLDGKVLIMNDWQEAKQKKLRGATGAMDNNQEAVVVVFGKAVLGGNGNVAGTVDNYGTIQPGDENTGTLYLKNFAESKKANLFVHPKSVLSFKIDNMESHDNLVVDGDLKYYNTQEDFTQSEDMPEIELVIADDADLKVGDEFCLLQANSKSSQNDSWQFELKTPSKYTWELVESEGSDGFKVVARVVSLENTTPDNPDDPDNPDVTEQMGPFYDDGINDAADKTSLRVYAAQNDKFIGTAISTWKNDISNASLAETKAVAEQFNMIVAENEMKFDALEPSQNQFSFSGADKIVNFAEKHQMKVRGHCFVWHNQLPQWVSSDGKKNDKNWTRQQALDIMKNHIFKVAEHYKGKVHEWDVVNECLDDDQTSVRTNPDAYDLRSSVWLKAIGEDYIDSAFVYAHQADPDALLYLNDYDVEFQGKAKSAAFYNLAVRLKNSGIPIDGVGLQCHFSIGGVDSLKLDNTIKRFAEVGLKCIITELDMGIPSTSSDDLQEQARNYRVLTDIVLKNDNCPNMVIWGLKDNNSWRESSSPLLYTAGLQPKPAYYAVRSALRHGALQKFKDGIQTTVAAKHVGSTAVYDLWGRRLAGKPHAPGIYIVDGKKVVVGY